MALRHPDSGDIVLFRLGRAPDPFTWPRAEYQGEGRYDDPEREFGVLYAGGSRLVCFLESLDRYRPDQAILQRLALFGVASYEPQTGLVPGDFFNRLIGRLRLEPGQRWLDLRISAPETAVALSRESAIVGRLPDLGYGARFKPGDLLGSDRRLTQLVARWAYEQGYTGLVYSCSHRPHQDCWAIFEGAAITIAEPPAPVDPGDPDLIAVAREFALTIAFVRQS